MIVGLVIRTTGSWYRVLVEGGEGMTGSLLDCRLRGNYRLRGNKQTNPVAVGDRVLFEMQEDGTGLIYEALTFSTSMPSVVIVYVVPSISRVNEPAFAT